MKSKNLYWTFLILLPLFIQCQSSPQQAQWRGPQRNGIYPAENLLKQWPKEGPELLWEAKDMGFGYSSAAVVDDRVFTAGAPDSIGYIYSYDIDGKLLWKKAYGREWETNFPGPRSTPLIYDGLGYLLSGLGMLYCFDAESGDMVWKKDVYDFMNNKNIRFGITENLLIDGNTLFCTPGGEEVNVIAMNRMNGDVLWKSKGNGEQTAYCSPIMIERNGRKLFITNTAHSIIAIDAKNGELAWSYNLTNKQNVHANTPIYQDGYLYVMDGFRAGSVMLKISDDGNSVSEVWKSDLLDETNGHSVLMGNNIYVSAESKKKFCCVDWKTGNIKYSIDKFSPGTVVAADGMLYCYSYNGDVGLLKPTPSGFEMKGEFKLPKQKRLHISHPVIKDGRLYIRYANNLWVYSVGGK